MNKLTGIFKFVIILLMVIGVLLIAFGIRNTFSFRNRTRDFLSTEGYYSHCELYSTGHSRGDHHSSPTYSLTYRYTVAGTDYTVTTDYGTSLIPEVGTPRTVYYNPDHPSDAALAGTSSSTVLIGVGAIFLLVPLIMGIALLAATGRLGRLSVHLMDLVIGGVLLLASIGTTYLISGSFSLRKLFANAGIFSIVPILFLITGIFLIGRGIFVQPVEDDGLQF